MAKLIVFEGIDRSGKSTQIERLYNYLTKLGQRVLKTREPWVESTRELLKNTELKSEHQLAIIQEDRYKHCCYLKENLDKYDVIICDRFTPSTLAYQGYGLGLDLNTIHDVNKRATQGLKPDLILLIDCPVRVAIKRSEKPLDAIEKNILFLEIVRMGYLSLASKYDYKMIDGSRPADRVFIDVFDEVNALFYDSVFKGNEFNDLLKLATTNLK
mgnify:CR=1 FL=1